MDTSDTIVAFHIGRGGRFHNAGHRSFIGFNDITAYTDDLFINYENESEIHRKIDGRENIMTAFERLLYNRHDQEIKLNFEAKTGLILGELTYTSNGENLTGLTLAGAETGIGKINIDNDYDTTYTCKLSNCDADELKLIYKSTYYMNSDVRDYVTELLGIGL